jgi:4'-phosphopantetheinyl transferase EntD
VNDDSLSPLALGRVALARVRRHERWFGERYLHERERQLARELRVDKRRVEFIAGRVAAKRALAGRGAAATEWSVLPATGASAGAPRVFGAGGAPLPIALSISHGADWAVAVAGDALRVGIDVERVERRAPSFLREAFAADELGRWAVALGGAPEDPHVVTVAWCAKEALLKLDECGLRAPLPGIVPDAIELYGGARGAWTRGRLRAGHVGHCQVALALDDERATVIVWSRTKEEQR